MQLHARKTDGALLQRLDEQLSPAAAAALQRLEHLCLEEGAALFLVCGTLRDLVLGLRASDVDLALEGDVPALARVLAARCGARAVVHPRFGTARVSGHGFRLDLARARRETYPRPGALPEVEPATIFEDMARRDFSINAFALRLTTPRGELIDPFGGLQDLQAGLLRVLHPASFQDDATRVLRGVRLATRLGLSFEKETLRLLRRDLHFLETISGARLRREFELLFHEQGAVEAVAMAQQLGVLQAVLPGLRVEPEVLQRWREALSGRHYAPVTETGFGVLVNPRTKEDVARASGRLHLVGRVQACLEDVVRLRDASDRLERAAGSPADASEVLDGFLPSAVWALSILEDGPAAGACRAYLQHWRHVRPHLSGQEIMAIGVPRGTAVGDLLRELRRARLEGRVATREEEERLARATVAAREGR